MSDARNIEELMLSVATDVSQGVLDVPGIMARHNLSQASFDALMRNAKFQSMVAQATKEWSAASNITARNELKSLIAYEQALPEMFSIMHDKSEPLTGRVEIMKLLAKVGKLGAQEREFSQGAERFQVTINIGADNALKYDKSPPKVINAEVE